jgi:hypothetical protein
MKHRSIFFPLALIATGFIWILVSMGRIPSENLWALAHFWPFLLIAAGVGLMLRTLWEPSRLIIDALVVGAAVLAILYAPLLGWNTPSLGFSFGFDGNFGGGTTGSGKVVSETRNVQDFLAVSVSYPANVLIQQGKTESVKIEAEDNLLPQLSTEMQNGTLIIRNEETDWSKRVNPTKPVRITIMVKDLRNLNFSSAGSVRVEKLVTDELSVSISGAGSLVLDQLNTRRLDCHLSGAGNANATGVADELKLSISGVGSFDGSNLFSKNADTHISGAGSATVHPKGELTAEISGTGFVHFYGTPHVTSRISGLGSVNKISD